MSLFIVSKTKSIIFLSLYFNSHNLLGLASLFIRLHYFFELKFPSLSAFQTLHNSPCSSGFCSDIPFSRKSSLPFKSISCVPLMGDRYLQKGNKRVFGYLHLSHTRDYKQIERGNIVLLIFVFSMTGTKAGI